MVLGKLFYEILTQPEFELDFGIGQEEHPEFEVLRCSSKKTWFESECVVVDIR